MLGLLGTKSTEGGHPKTRPERGRSSPAAPAPPPPSRAPASCSSPPAEPSRESPGSLPGLHRAPGEARRAPPGAAGDAARRPTSHARPSDDTRELQPRPSRRAPKGASLTFEQTGTLERVTRQNSRVLACSEEPCSCNKPPFRATDMLEASQFRSTGILLGRNWHASPEQGRTCALDWHVRSA